jgi:hypothetical protein
LLGRDADLAVGWIDRTASVEVKGWDAFRLVRSNFAGTSKYPRHPSG